MNRYIHFWYKLSNQLKTTEAFSVALDNSLLFLPRVPEFFCDLPHGTFRAQDSIASPQTDNLISKFITPCCFLLSVIQGLPYSSIMSKPNLLFFCSLLSSYLSHHASNPLFPWLPNPLYFLSHPLEPAIAKTIYFLELPE